ncbi:hypothetical protein SAMN05880557_103287 [Pseudacidovorax sp. RU35E]|nr:hypothetical protein SAMN05880557_103287 [Pseudacidovorax sp. RU35E]
MKPCTPHRRTNPLPLALNNAQPFALSLSKRRPYPFSPRLTP